MQLNLLETQRFAALCHNEGPTLDEEPILATAQRNQGGDLAIANYQVAFGSPPPSLSLSLLLYAFSAEGAMSASDDMGC
jgi:hypothetical protein